MNACRHFLVLILLLSPTMLLAQPPGWQKEYDRLLKKYVVDGGVRYAAWKANASDMAALNRVVTGIGNADPSKLDANGQLAFYINAYNAWTIKLILDKYPVRSVRDVSPLFGIFLQKKIRVAGEQMSLNHLEKNILRKKFKDPRIHFAVNCGSTSCPPLQKGAYDAKTLNKELEARTKAFTLNEAAVEKSPDGKVRLSRIFKWYDEDFEGGAVDYVSKRRGERVAPGEKVEYKKYDWSLNDRQ
jgi:hypothetical protein